MTTQPDKQAAEMWAPSKIVTMKTPLYSPRPFRMKMCPKMAPPAAAAAKIYGVGLNQALKSPVDAVVVMMPMRPFKKNTLPIKMPAMTPKEMPRNAGFNHLFRNATRTIPIAVSSTNK
mmetsp:Transcript_21394/g.43064  ORF Transcript_21394/g.43064 Transcript_21394/m.43064 type:complete len:118 (-) Transcript_21394:35-388(-)